MGRELLLDEVEEAVALGHRRVVGEVPGVERREVVAAQIAPVRLVSASQVSSSVVSERMVLTPRGARGRSALIIGGVTLVRTRDSKLPLRRRWRRRWVRELVQYCRKVAVSWESSSVRG